MNRREAIEATARENALLNAGISREDVEALRRISMTLHRWHEKECGIDGGCIERDERWAIERAAWNKADPIRWWDGSAWHGKAFRRTYSDAEKATAGALRADGAWRDVGAKPYWHDSTSGRRWQIPDSETGARKRLAAIMARYERSHSCGYFGPCTTCPTCVQPTTLGLRAYVQGDPRGCALYILRPGDAPVGQEDSHYSRGLAVY